MPIRRALIPILVLLAMVAGAVSLLAGPGASAQSGDDDTQAQSTQAEPEQAANEPPQATLELTIWQGVDRPLDFWISSRADDEAAWTQAEVEMALQEGGGWRVGDLTVTAGDHDFDLRLWHDPAETDEDTEEIWLSARLTGELWSDYGTQQVELDQVSGSGSWNYGNVSLALPLRSPDEPDEDPEYVPVGVCPPEDQTKTYAYIYVWQRKTALDSFWITHRTASNQKWKTVKLSMSSTETDADAADADDAGENEDSDQTEEAGADADEEQTWNVGDLTIVGRRGALDLRLWQDPDDLRKVWLSARSSGAGWDDYGTRQWALDRTSRSGKYWYRLQTVSVAVPDNEAAEPGRSTTNWAGWDCNSAPTANAGEDQTVNANVRVTLDGTASSDPNGDALTYAWTGPEGITLANADTDTATFTTTAAQVGQTLTFTLTVTDPGGKSASDEVEITVQRPAPVIIGGGGGGGGAPPTSPGQQQNQAPTADAGDDIPASSAVAGAIVRLSGSDSNDPDGDNTKLTYAWTQDTTTTDTAYYTTAITLTNAVTATPSFTVPGDAHGKMIKFTLKVTDEKGTASTNTGDQATVVVTVHANQPPPTPSPSASPTSGKPETKITLTAAAVTDPDGDTVTYKWTKDSSSTYTGTVAINSDTSLTAANFDVPSGANARQTIVLRLTASDDGTPSASSHATVTVTVTAELTTSNVTARSATLTIAGWSGNWYYKSATAGKTQCANAGTGTSTDVRGLSPGTAYTFTAYSDSGCTTANKLDEALSFTTPAELAASNVTATGATLTLAGHTANAEWWYKSTTTGQKTCTSAGTGTSVTLTGLDEGESYTYSAYSNDTCATVIATAATFKTGFSLEASVTARTATLDINGHDTVWYYRSAATTCMEAAARTAANLTNLTPGTEYTYTAYSDRYCSDALASVTFKTTPALTSSNPTATGATLTIDGHRSDWYYKYTSPSGGTCSSSAVSTSSVDLTGLTPGTAYVYAAYSASGCADTTLLTGPEDQAQFTTLAQLTASDETATTVTLTIDGHSGNWYYKSTTAGQTNCTGPVTPGTTSSVIQIGLTPGTSYTYSAYRPSGCASANLLATALQFTTKVAELTSSNVAKNSATLSLSNWDTANEVKWHYKSATSGKTDCTAVAAGTASVNVTGLTAGTAYKFTAYRDSGCTTVIAAGTSFTTTANVAPTVSISNVNLTAGNTVSLSATANDTDGSIKEYSWSVTGKSTGAPDASLTGETTAKPGLVVPSSAWKTSPHHTYTVSVTVKDNDGATASHSATLTVNNRPPSAVAKGNTPARPGETVSLIGLESTDPDGDTLTCTWAKTGGSYGGSITIENNGFCSSSQFTMPSNAVSLQTIVLTMTAKDTKGGTDTAQFTVTVRQ